MICPADSLLQDQNNARHYKQLGLEPGATVRDVESDYWRIARELKGQPAMPAYNDAYEALVSKARRPTDAAEFTQATPAPAATVKAERAVRPPSKLGWPA